jgi:hypothetical protein
LKVTASDLQGQTITLTYCFGGVQSFTVALSGSNDALVTDGYPEAGVLRLQLLLVFAEPAHLLFVFRGALHAVDYPTTPTRCGVEFGH